MWFGRFAAVSGVLCLVAPTARGDEVPSLDLRGFQPPTDQGGSLYLEPTATPGPWKWNVGAWASYARRLVRVEDAAGRELAVPVENQFSMDYYFGIGVGDRFALGAVLPTVLYQSGQNAELLGSSPPHAALGDARLNLKATLLPGGELGGFSVAVLAAGTAPTGNASSYIAEDSVTGELRVLSELRLVAVAVRASTGLKLRATKETFAGHTFGHELPWGVGLMIRPQALGIDEKGRWQWSLEAHGAVALTPRFGSKEQSRAALGLSARYTPGAISLMAGVEAPLDAAIGVPVIRPVVGLDWAPRVHDLDADGVPDEIDQCPELGEDKDGFEDGDGCPDFDNDDDGVPDDSDRCPTEKEDSDDFEDEDGCPDPDNDHDGVFDAVDACPKDAGANSADPLQNGCPPRDGDGDGIDDTRDKCPTKPEDRDGFEDDDGCPEEDNDGDQVPDGDDACPSARGPERSDPLLNGCPSPDRDGDSFDDEDDRCPEQAENFDGVEDGDGCPEAAPSGRKPARDLVSLEPARKRPALVVRGPVTFVTSQDSVELAPKSEATVRAIASLLNQHPKFVLLVGVRARSGNARAEQMALNQSFALVSALRRLTHRDEVAESVSFQVVKQTKGAAARGVGFSLLE